MIPRWHYHVKWLEGRSGYTRLITFLRSRRMFGPENLSCLYWGMGNDHGSFAPQSQLETRCGRTSLASVLDVGISRS